MTTHAHPSDSSQSAYITPLVAAGLTLLTVIAMYGFAFTALSQVNAYLFSIPIVGIIIFGIALTGGYALARRGLTNGRTPLAYLGTLILVFTYAVFGGGIVGDLSMDFRIPALILTGVITAALTVVLSICVTQGGADFSSWEQHSTKAFIVGLILGLIGSLFTPVLVLAFACFLAGFTLRLGHDIHKAHSEADYGPFLMAIELYISVTGVFVHILQLVSLADR